jgi:hypothetical protein
MNEMTKDRIISITTDRVGEIYGIGESGVLYLLVEIKSSGGDVRGYMWRRVCDSPFSSSKDEPL